MLLQQITQRNYYRKRLCTDGYGRHPDIWNYEILDIANGSMVELISDTTFILRQEICPCFYIVHGADGYYRRACPQMPVRPDPGEAAYPAYYSADHQRRSFYTDR